MASNFSITTRFRGWMLRMCWLIFMSFRAVITTPSSNTNNRTCETYASSIFKINFCLRYGIFPCHIPINVSGFSLPPYLNRDLNDAPHWQDVYYMFNFKNNKLVSDFSSIWSNGSYEVADVHFVLIFPLTRKTICVFIHVPLDCGKLIVHNDTFDAFCDAYVSGEPDTTKTANRFTNWLFSAEHFTLLYDHDKKELSIINKTCSGKYIVPILAPPAILNTEIINIIYTNCTFDLHYFFSKYSPVYAVNLTGSVSTVSKLLDNLLMYGFQGFLRSLDISHSNLYSFVRLKVSDQQISTRPCYLRNFYARNCVPFSCSVHTKIYEHVACIEVRLSNDSSLAKIICIQPESLELLDIAENNIDYIDISFTDVFTRLKILDISRNFLKTVRLYGGGDLNLSRLTRLTELYCSNNELKTLGTDIFDLSPNLTEIDLSFNKLATITFRVNHLHQLRLLNLYKNEIKLFAPSFMSEQLASLVIYLKINSDITIEINLAENPLICTSACDNKDAVAWLLQNENKIRFWPMSCELEHNSRIISNLTLDNIQEMCNRPLYIGLASTITTVLIIIIVVVLCRYRLGLRRKRRLLHLVQKFKDVGRDRFPVFLSFCSSNADFVMETVFEELNRRLKELLGTNRRCVAFGDADFRPGAVVIEEMIRCISRCHMVIICVSNDFLRSPWCTDEVRITHFQRKPIILMFLEEVDMKLLAKSILFLYFMRSCRAKWINVDGRFKLQPEWDVFCRSVVSHMDEHAAESDEEETIV